MNNQLIPVFNGVINGESALLCDARDLHEYLEVGKNFSNWIVDRLSEYKFVANVDYVRFSPNLVKTPGRPKKDYHLTMDTAKELSMVERNEKGREARRYFIECEKQVLRQKAPEIIKPAPAQNAAPEGVYYRDVEYSRVYYREVQHRDLPWGVQRVASKRNPYRALLRHNGQLVHVGQFPTVEEAVAAIEHFERTGEVQRIRHVRRSAETRQAPETRAMDFCKTGMTALEAESLIVDMQSVLYSVRFLNEMWREKLLPILRRSHPQVISKMHDRFVDSMSVVPYIEACIGKYERKQRFR